MRWTRFSPAAGRRGFYLIGVLIVLVIIMVVVMKGPMSRDPVSKVTTAQTQIDRSRVSTCMLNRNAIKTDLTRLLITNPNMTMNMDIIRRRINIPPCPGAGVYLRGQDAQVYCTQHFPAPASQMQQMVQITEDYE